MSEQEGPIVEAVEESVSVVDAAPEAPSNPMAAEAASIEPEAGSASDNGSDNNSSAAPSTADAEPSANAEDATSAEDASNNGESGGEADATSTATDSSSTESAETTADSPAVESPAAESSTDSSTGSSTESESAPASEPKEDDGPKKVIRLTVGQEITGTVKRLTDFGAFVDLGVGRDGLLHVSELSVQRVNKVSDVLSQGQEVTVWIKELNREKNRISLTLISPDTKTIRDINKDDVLEGTVTRMTNFGAFIDIGIGRDALLHVREMAEGFVKRPEDIVTIGETFEVRVVELNRRRGRVDLSIKGLRPEPAGAEPTGNEGFADGVDEVFVDEFENVEPMSAIELALKRAMGDGDDGGSRSKRAKRKEKRSQTEFDEMDEIVSRTLTSSEL